MSARQTAVALALVFGVFAVLGYFLAGAPAWLFRPVVFGVVAAVTLYCALVVFAHAAEASPDAAPGRATGEADADAPAEPARWYLAPQRAQEA